MKVGTFTAGIVGIVLLASRAASQTPVATDGDAIPMDGRPYRLWGIDAPERPQECPDGWPAGRMALTRLQELVRNKYVVCQRTGSDRAGRIVAICRVSGQDLAALLVSEGLAWAFRRDGDDYVDLEAEAKAAGLGIHARDCMPAWEWRAEQPR